MNIEWRDQKIKITDGDRGVTGIAEVHSSVDKHDILIRILNEQSHAEIATLLIKDNVPKLDIY